jgi:hypothetical protein
LLHEYGMRHRIDRARGSEAAGRGERSP